MKAYMLEKVSDINYRMAVHEGNANARLASEATKILLLPENTLPEQYETKLSALKKLIGLTLQGLSAPGLTPTRLKGMQNAKAAKYIELLIEIEEHVKAEKGL